MPGPIWSLAVKVDQDPTVQHPKFSLFFCLALIILIYMVVGDGTYVSYSITPSLCT